MHTVVVVAPTWSEYGAVRRALARLPGAGAVELVMCGMGPQRASALCRRLEERGTLPAGLFLIGVAGGLDPALGLGAAVLADAALDEGGSCVPCAVIPLRGVAVGPVLTVGRALYAAAEKAAARATGALAVEMEAYPLAAWAAARGLPFVHARAILDPLGEALPDLEDAVDGFGRVRPARLARRLLAQPGLAGPLVRLARQMRVVAPVLGALASEVLAGWEAVARVA